MLTDHNENTTEKIKEIEHCITHYQEPLIYSYQLNISVKDFTRLKKFIRKHSELLNLKLDEKQLDEIAKKNFIHRSRRSCRKH